MCSMKSACSWRWAAGLFIASVKCAILDANTYAISFIIVASFSQENLLVVWGLSSLFSLSIVISACLPPYYCQIDGNTKISHWCTTVMLCKIMQHSRTLRMSSRYHIRNGCLRIWNFWTKTPKHSPIFFLTPSWNFTYRVFFLEIGAATVLQ